MMFCTYCNSWTHTYADCAQRTLDRAKAREARYAAVRQSMAEDVATNTPLPATWKAGADMTDKLQAEIVAYGIACALGGIDRYRGKA